MSDWTICNGCGQRIPTFDYAHACPAQTGGAVIAPSAWRTVMAGDSQDSELDRLRKENAALLKIKECAQRLADHAESGLGGCLSDDSPARDIPSNAVSMVKARHLASLRAALQGAKDD